MLKWRDRPPALISRIAQLALAKLCGPGHRLDSIGADQQGSAFFPSILEASRHAVVIRIEADAVGSQVHHALVERFIQRPLHVCPAHHHTRSPHPSGQIVYRYLY